MATTTSLGFSIFSVYDGRGVSRARRDVRGLNDDMGTVKVGSASAKMQFSALTTSALALAPALIPIGGTLLGIGAGATAMGTAAALGFGVFAKMVKEQIGNISNMNSAHMKLTGTEKKFLDVQDKLGIALGKFSQQTRSQTVAPLVPLFKGLTVAVKELTPAFNAAAAGVMVLGRGFGKYFSGHEFANFSKVLTADVRPIVGNLSSAFVTLFRVFLQGVKVFLPMGVQMSGVLKKGADMLQKWSDGGGFARFLDYLRKNGPAVKQFFITLMGALKNVGGSLADMGPAGLALATILAKIIAAMPPSVIQALAIAYESIRLSMILYAAAAGVAAFVNWWLADSSIAAAAGADMSRIAALKLVIAQVAQSIWTGIVTVATVAWMAANYAAAASGLTLSMTLGLIILAIAALVIGIYFLVTNWSTVCAALKVAWNATWTFIKAYAFAVWTAIQVYFKVWLAVLLTAFSIFRNLFTGNWSGMWNSIKALGAKLWAAIHQLWDATLGRMGLSWTRAGQALKSAWNAVWSAIRNAFNAVCNAIANLGQGFWNRMSDKYNAGLNYLKARWNAGWNAVKSAYSAVCNAVVNLAQGFWNKLTQKYSAGKNWIMTTFWNPLNNFFRKTMPNAWSAAVSSIGKAWDKLKHALATPVKIVVDSVYTNGLKKVWDAVAGIFHGPKLPKAPNIPGYAKGGAIRGAGSGTSDSIQARLSHGEHVWTAKEVTGAGGHGAVARMRSAAMGGRAVRGAVGGANGTGFSLGGWIPDPIKDAFNGAKNVAKGAWDGVKGFGSDIIGKLKDLALGGVSVVVNPLLDKVSSAGQAAVRKAVPGDGAGIEKVGVGVVKQMIDLVKKWIKNNDTAPTSANLGGAVKWADAQVGKPYSLGAFGDAFDCSNYMSGIAKAILGETPGPWFTTHPFEGGAKEPIKGFVRDLKAPFMIGITSSGIGHTAGTLNGTNYEATPPKVRKGSSARGYDDPMFQYHYGFKPSLGGGQIPTGEHLKLIDAALKAAGVSKSDWGKWESGMNTLIMRESGWNAGAINMSDSNAAAGMPSQGLAQVIGPTFDSYWVPGTAHNILDPVANIAAAIRYIQRNYGDISKVQQANASMPPMGYKLGTTSARRGIAWVGDELVNFGGGERVIANNKLRATGQEKAGASTVVSEGAFQIIINGEVTEETMDRVDNELIPKLKMALMAGTGAKG